MIDLFLRLQQQQVQSCGGRKRTEGTQQQGSYGRFKTRLLTFSMQAFFFVQLHQLPLLVRFLQHTLCLLHMATVVRQPQQGRNQRVVCLSRSSS